MDAQLWFFCCCVLTMFRSGLDICNWNDKSIKNYHAVKTFGLADHSTAAAVANACYSPIAVICCPSFCIWLGDRKSNVLCSNMLFCHHILIKSMMPVWVSTRLLHFWTVSPWKQFFECFWIDMPWVCYSCVTSKAAFCLIRETCTVFYLFTCPIPDVYSQLAQSIPAQLKPQSALQTLIQPLQTRLQISQSQGDMTQEAGQMQF